MSRSVAILPKAYVWRRIHSLFGLMIVLFLIEHLVTNSQAALLFGENGAGFIRAVNFIKNLPYLPALEIFLIGVPILFHGVLGVRYALKGKMNSFPGSGKEPSLTRYKRNHAYSWQRITSWILLIGIILHVGYMRFYRYPTHVKTSDQEFYFTKVEVDPGLYSVAFRLGAKIYNATSIKKREALFIKQQEMGKALEKKAQAYFSEESDKPLEYSAQEEKEMTQFQKYEQEKAFIKALTKQKLSSTEVILSCPDFGTATLLMVRDSFKSPFKAALYTIFVLAACFHAFNGLWTFCITWGVVIKATTQAKLSKLCVGIMVVIAFLGLASIWGTYWINLAN